MTDLSLALSLWVIAVVLVIGIAYIVKPWKDKE